MKKSLLSFSIMFLVIGALSLFSSKTYAVPVSPDKYFIEMVSDETVSLTNKPGMESQALVIYGQEQLEGGAKVYISVLGMRKVGEENDREFYIADSSNMAEAANWISLSQSEAIIQPGRETIIPWSITASSEATCGTNLAAIAVSTEPLETSSDGGESKVVIRQQIISQVHIDIVETDNDNCENNNSKLELVQYKVDKFPLFNHPDVPFVVKLENKGNVIARSPEGFIEIFGFGGKKATIPFNNQSLDVYPATTRKFSLEWVDENYPEDGSVVSKFFYELIHPKFGRYEARLGVTKNVSPAITESVYFWIIPWKLILFIVLVVGIVGTLVYRMRRAEKQLKKMSSRK